MGAPTNIWYSNIAAVMAGNVNILANLDDPNLSSGRMSKITATYTFTGNEVSNDVVYLARVPSGALVEPTGTIATPGGNAATTLTVQVGDTDTVGGTVAYDPARYSAAQDVHAQTTTTAVNFSGGTALITNPVPPQIYDDWVWIVATFATIAVPVSGKTLVFRITASQLD